MPKEHVPSKITLETASPHTLAWWYTTRGRFQAGSTEKAFMGSSPVVLTVHWSEYKDFLFCSSRALAR